MSAGSISLARFFCFVLVQIDTETDANTGTSVKEFIVKVLICPIMSIMFHPVL